MSRLLHGVLGLSMGLALGVRVSSAETLGLPNASFESPVTTFVNINIDAWLKTPEPAWYASQGSGFLWTQLTGLFKNQPPSASDYIDNCDGAQGCWLFAVPEVGLFMDYEAMGGSNAPASRVFDARFEMGRSYQLTVGVIGGGAGMFEGASLELGLYFRDAASNIVMVAARGLTNSLAVFSNTTHFVDCQVQTPVVKSGDAWAGQHIGVRLLSTVSLALQQGYWDLDNVRLTSIREPVFVGTAVSNAQVHFTIECDAGVLEMLASPNLTVPVSNWTRVGLVTNLTGTVPFVDATTNSAHRFYRARQVQ